MFWKTVEKNSLVPKEELYRNIRLDESIEVITGPGYYAKEIELQFSIAEDGFRTKIIHLIRYIKENSYSILSENKVSKVKDIIALVIDEIFKYDRKTFERSVDEFNESIYELWLHYLYEIDKLVDELYAEQEYLIAIDELENIISNKTIGDEDILFIYNYKSKSIAKDVKQVKIRMSGIALIHFYEQDPIDISNAAKILEGYGWKSATKLVGQYKELTNDYFRHNYRDFKITYDSIYERLSNSAKIRAMDDLELFRSSKKNQNSTSY